MDDSADLRTSVSRAEASGAVSFRDVVLPVLRQWRWLTAASVIAVALALTLLLLRARRFEAKVVVATVSSQPGLNLGGAAALLASAGGGAAPTQSGLQVSPLLIADLMVSRRVLLAVGMSTTPGAGQRVVDIVADEAVPDAKIVEEMQRVISARVAKETGLVSLAVVLPDSGLAREMARRIIAEVTRTYVETARAQASQLRRAQDVRVDSARRSLARLEQEQQLFQAANREVPSFSELATKQQSLQRDLGVAEQVYSKAISDRESAIAKELEETPVVVTVDPLPATLPPTSRRIPLFVGLTLVAVLAMGLLWIFMAEAFNPSGTSTPVSDAETGVVHVNSRSRGRAGA